MIEKRLYKMREQIFNVWFSGEHLNTFTSLKEAQKCITEHPKYKKSYFTKKGDASGKNPNKKECFRIYDNNGYGWYIK
jgi:hypothetical protein